MPERRPRHQIAAIVRLGPQELESRDAERAADPSDVIERDIGLAAFDGADESPMDLRPVRELFLTDAQFLPPSPDVLCENAPKLGWGCCCHEHNRPAKMRTLPERKGST